MLRAGRQPRRNTRDTLMTSTMSRRRHNYISLLGIPCRINCIVSACPLCDSRVSVAPSVALGDVAIRGATPRVRGLPQPLRVAADAPRASPPPNVLCFMFRPTSATSLISSPSPRGALIINKAFSAATCCNRPECSWRKTFASCPFNVTVNCDLCAESAPVRRSRN